MFSEEFKLSEKFKLETKVLFKVLMYFLGNTMHFSSSPGNLQNCRILQTGRNAEKRCRNVFDIIKVT